MALSTAQRRVKEETTAIYSAVLKDEDDLVIAGSQIDAITLTYYNKEDGTIINSRSRQDVLNANNVTIDSSGNLEWILQPADTTIISTEMPAGAYETHVGLFEWTWGTTKQGRHEVEIDVLQMHEVTLDIGSTLITSWGGGTSNSYVSLTDANSFVTYSVVNNSAWADATPEQRVAAVLEASRDVDSRQYLGRRKYSVQLLEFPREIDASYPWSRTTYQSASLSDSEARMKEDVKQATCYQALWILQQSGRNQHQEAAMAGISEVEREVGPIRERYRYRGVSETIPRALCPAAVMKLANWMSGKRAIRG